MTERIETGTRVLAAMSGGVDSSVAAALLKDRGYDVIGVTLRLWAPETDDVPPGNRHCCAIEDLDDARAAAHAIGIPHYVLNMEERFHRDVVDYFVDEYRRGRTPNPCIACNDEIKFGDLLRKADELGARYLATGHYARVASGEGTLRLLRARNEEKDQSYVLYGLDQRRLARILFPLGELESKADTRAIARSLGLHLADKPESADVCFVPDGDTRAFLGERLGRSPGDVVDAEGRAIGRHDGVVGYTVGQRRGLGVATGQRAYVTAIDVATNVVTIGSDDDLLADWLETEETRFVAGAAGGPFRCEVRIRYRSAGVPATVEPQPNAAALVRFERPVRAVAAGQAAVFYRDDEVLGGGIIRRSGRSAKDPCRNR